MDCFVWTKAEYDDLFRDPFCWTRSFMKRSRTRFGGLATAEQENPLKARARGILREPSAATAHRDSGPHQKTNFPPFSQVKRLQN